MPGRCEVGCGVSAVEEALAGRRRSVFTLGCVAQRSRPFQPGPPFVAIHQRLVLSERFFRQILVNQHRLDGHAARVDRLAESVVAVGHLDVGEHDVRIFDVAIGRTRIGFDGPLEFVHRVEIVSPLEVGIPQHSLTKQVEQTGRLFRLQAFDQDLELILGLVQLPLNFGPQFFSRVVGFRFLEFVARENGSIPQRLRQQKPWLRALRHDSDSGRRTPRGG